LPPNETTLPTSSQKPLPPLSLLMPAGTDQLDSSTMPLNDGGLLPRKMVPFYNGVTAFPLGSQRAALHNLLTNVARETRIKQGLTTSRSELDGNLKYSHAFLLCSDSENVKRGDAAAIAIALWRLHMFEGGGWTDRTQSWSMGTNCNVEKLL